MSLFYWISYTLGIAPWEEAATHPPAARHVAAIFDRERDERNGLTGRALDVGCGSGIWSVELARRGWDVTGIDIVPRALDKARRRAEAERVRAQFVLADLTAPPAAGIVAGFDFLWDFGAVHGLSGDGRRRAGRTLTALAAPGATLALLAWRPGRRGPLPRGASREEIASAFPAWRVLSEERFDATGLPAPLRRVDPRIHRLRLTG